MRKAAEEFKKALHTTGGKSSPSGTFLPAFRFLPKVV